MLITAGQGCPTGFPGESGSVCGLRPGGGQDRLSELPAPNEHVALHHSQQLSSMIGHRESAPSPFFSSLSLRPGWDVSSVCHGVISWKFAPISPRWPRSKDQLAQSLSSTDHRACKCVAPQQLSLKAVHRLLQARTPKAAPCRRTLVNPLAIDLWRTRTKTCRTRTPLNGSGPHPLAAAASNRLPV